MAKNLRTARFDLPAVFPGPLAENGKRSEQRESGEDDPAHVAPSPPRASFSNTLKSLAARLAVSPRPPAEAALFFFEGAFLRVALFKSMPTLGARTKAPRKPGRSNFQPIRASRCELRRLGLQKLAGTRDWNRPRLHRLWNLACEVDV
jgi:hypothetical protein